MKQDIHPPYTSQAKMTCACGAIYLVGSTMPEVHIEVCASCHPFYTGKQKMLHTARRVEKFADRKKKAETMKEARIKKPKADIASPETQENTEK